MNEGAVERRFLGWERPLLHSIVEALVQDREGDSALDLSDALVVLPGARAGRRLKELLLDRADRSGRILRPPEVSTVGKLPERLYQQVLPPPGSVVGQQAWRRAFTELPPKDLARLMPFAVRSSTGEDDVAATLATLVGELQEIVASAGMDFRGVARLCREGSGFSDEARWLVLAEGQDRYREILNGLGFRDRTESRQIALSRGHLSTELRLWVCAAPDLPPVVRMFLKRMSSPHPVQVLVGAPEAFHQAFDSLGCVVPEAWADVRAQLPDEVIRLTQGPADQADAVVSRLQDMDGTVSAEEISIGVPDPEVVPYLAERLSEEGVQVRYAAGHPITRTGIFRLLEDLARYLEEPEFRHLGTLVRHPPLECAVSVALGEEAADLPGLLDRYQAVHLQGRIDPTELPSGAERRSMPLQPRVRRLTDALGELLAPLEGRRSLASWSPRLAEVLVALPPYGSRDEGADGNRSFLPFIESVRSVLEEFEGLPGALDPPVSAAQAIRRLLDEIREVEAPPEAGEGAVELLGWLELPLDDAQVMVVTGCNEPHVPQSVTSHSFLPHSLRQRMGLLDNAGRWARDLLFLLTMMRTRSDTALIAGRWDGEGNPLLPSRLLFAEEPIVVAERVKRCFTEEEASLPPGTPDGPRNSAVEPSKGRAEHAEAESLQRDLWESSPEDSPAPEGESRSGFRLPPEPTLCAPVVPDRIRVTAFRTILADPYRYALETLLGLRSVHDEARELDPLGFGSLTHRVLERFGRDPSATSAKASTVRRTLVAILDREARSQFGSEPLATVRLQIHQLTARLEAFAEWQAEWVERGWRIQRIEASPPGEGAEFDVDGEPILLRGKLDRVDLNERTGHWCVLDYKTGERVLSPEESHRRGPARDRRWVDLQLPLYRRLAAVLPGSEGAPLIPSEALAELFVGYVAISRDLRVRSLLAEWTPAEFAEAEEAARRVVRLLRENRFVYDPSTTTIQGVPDLAPVVGGRALHAWTIDTLGDPA